ncbi:MAG TPA: hypothetical protein VNQ14_13145 [Woeseiaceae bacterium]|nr:hypothetical protein [Woeseiaceae bacterium]
MTDDARKSASGRLQITLIALVFGVPFLLAAWLYYDESLQPSGRTNHGSLLAPIVNLHEAVPDSLAVELSDDHWLLVYANDGECDAQCRDALYALRQSRLMLGNDMRRLTRVFLHGEFAPDRVFIEAQHPGLRVLQDRSLGDLLASSRPDPLPSGGYFLVDPLGNLVMYFPPDIVPGDMVDDIEHLLDVSRIG